MEDQLAAVRFCQLLDRFNWTLQPVSHLKHRLQIERFLQFVPLRSAQTTQGALLNALLFQPGSQWKAELPLAGFDPEIPIALRFTIGVDRNLQTDLQAFAWVKECDTGSMGCEP